MSSGQNPKITTMEEASDIIDAAVTKLKKILEETHEPNFESSEYLEIYTMVYKSCTQKSPHDLSQQLYDKYWGIFEDYATHTVLPSIMEKHDEDMLRELCRRWDNNKIMVRWLSRFFYYLDCYFTKRRCLPRITEVGMICFRDHVYQKVHFNVKQVIIAMIHKEREGQQIDRALLKNVLDVFVQIGMGSLERYEEDFEMFFLQETAFYYSRKASRWIQEDSCPEYMIKAKESLKKETERVAHYLHSDTEPTLVEIVQSQLLVSVAKQLLEKERSGCSALLSDDKMDDLSRMYRLYHAIPNGLEPVAEAFRLHVTAQGNTLIKQAEDAATSGSVEEQVLVRKIVNDLRDKYMVYVTDCFQNHTLFHKALTDSFSEIYVSVD